PWGLPCDFGYRVEQAIALALIVGEDGIQINDYKRDDSEQYQVAPGELSNEVSHDFVPPSSLSPSYGRRTLADLFAPRRAISWSKMHRFRPTPVICTARDGDKCRLRLPCGYRYNERRNLRRGASCLNGSLISSRFWTRRTPPSVPIARASCPSTGKDARLASFVTA